MKTDGLILLFDYSKGTLQRVPFFLCNSRYANTICCLDALIFKKH